MTDERKSQIESNIQLLRDLLTVTENGAAEGNQPFRTLVRQKHSELLQQLENEASVSDRREEADISLPNA